MTGNAEQGTLCGVEHLVDIPHLEAIAPTRCAIDPLGDLLRTLSETPDIRRSFRQVARAANMVISHDCLELVVHDQTGHVLLQVRSSEGLPWSPTLYATSSMSS